MMTKRGMDVHYSTLYRLGSLASAFGEKRTYSPALKAASHSLTSDGPRFISKTSVFETISYVSS
jgi:hypothetical protein